MMARFLLSFWRDQRGAAAAEMALMTPLLMMLMFGPMELGHFFWTQHKITKSVRDGARFAARQNFSNFVCPSTVSAADIPLYGESLETVVRNVTVYGNVAGSGSAKVPGLAPGDIEVTLDCDPDFTQGIYNGQSEAPVVRVELTGFTYPSLFETLGFDAADIPMTAYSEAAVMGL
jgi:hypothetical protein